tara:strand:- start:948 stop:2549 length:1602 start_codon:yes stop_codon:yes gene_type:complete
VRTRTGVAEVPPSVETQLKLTPPEEQTNINALSALLETKGLDASDFIDVINALANIKQRDAAKEEKDAEKEEASKQKKIFVDKEFVYETRQDVFIYKDGRTKSGRYYVRIYDEKTKRVFSQSLRTTNRIEALAKAEQLYRENKDAMRRGVKLVSINTKELIRLYENERRKTITDIPHQGITYTSFNNLCKMLKKWEMYIAYTGNAKTPLENIPPEIGKRFAIWLKESDKDRYKGTERSNETINHYVAAVKKMYRDIAIEEKYITMAEFPIMRYLKVNREVKPKRDILEQEEFTNLRKWMTNKWCREKDISEEERLKRRIYGLYLTIQYYGGFRNKEILGIRWKDISAIPTESKDDQRINRAIFIPASNSKTGRSRSCVAPVAIQFERIREHYKKANIEINKDDFVFINLAKTKRGKNIPYQQPAMEKRLRSVVVGSGLQEKLDETGRHITQYSARHFAATNALMRGVSIYDLAVNLGTSVFYIERTYSHITAMMKSKELTKGQGYWKVIEQGGQLKEFEQANGEPSIKDEQNL